MQKKAKRKVDRKKKKIQTYKVAQNDLFTSVKFLDNFNPQSINVDMLTLYPEPHVNSIHAKKLT